MSQSIPWVPLPPPSICRALSTVFGSDICFLQVSSGVGNLLEAKKSNICRLFCHNHGQSTEFVINYRIDFKYKYIDEIEPAFDFLVQKSSRNFYFVSKGGGAFASM